MSTSASHAELVPSWKQEVNRRLAAHKSRKDSSTAEPEAPTEVHYGASARAAQAAARVAARYAKAPSYSELLAADARAAVRAAEAASWAALQAKDAAESVLAGLEAASGVETAVEPVEPSASDSRRTFEKQSFAIRWQADMPARATESAATRATHGLDVFKIPVEAWREPAAAWDGQDALGGAEGIEMVEPARPIHANLIEFPREIVATRKVRPRLAKGPDAAAGKPQGQLSIFEVEPGTISTQPAAADAVAEAAAAWPGPEWLGIELDEEPRQETAYQAGRAAAAAATTPAAAALQLAPMNLRLMAVVVDGALITGAFLAAAMVAAANAKDLPNLHEIELGAAGALAVIGALYQALFFTLADATPGMKYARIFLCAFDGQRPTRAQRRGRLGALLLSLLPVGLGVAWAIFDEEHLSWHDRLSRTYLRKC